MKARWLVIFGVLLAFAAAAEARQHLVSAGSDWEELQNQIRPGDEIILMPGTHRPADFSNLHGEPEKAIIIRGLDPEHPAQIKADQYGLRLYNPRYVKVQDIRIKGATVCGLLIDDKPLDGISRAGEGETGNTTGEKPVFITLLRLAIARTGPEGKRHALEAEGVERLRIEKCSFDGWAGSAIELVGCQDVNIEKCQFTGRDDHSQSDGVRIRAGSDRVLIDQCRFDHCAARCINLGAAGPMEDFRPPIPKGAEPGSVFHTRRVTVTRTKFTGGGVPFVLSHADGCVIRNNTVVRPSPWVVVVADGEKDPAFGPTRNTQFGSNLIVWQAGDLKRLAEVTEIATSECLVFEENLWWSDESAEDRARLAPLPGQTQWPQITDVDPQLDRDLKPTNKAAELFGADSP